MNRGVLYKYISLWNETQVSHDKAKFLIQIKLHIFLFSMFTPSLVTSSHIVWKTPLWCVLLCIMHHASCIIGTWFQCMDYIGDRCAVIEKKWANSVFWSYSNSTLKLLQSSTNRQTDKQTHIQFSLYNSGATSKLNCYDFQTPNWLNFFSMTPCVCPL